MSKPKFTRKADGSTVLVADGLQNLVSGLGTDRDKSASSTYTIPFVNDFELMNAYRGTWLAKKIVDIPAKDACRAWRNWKAPAEEITLLDAEERRLGLQDKVRRAKISARLLGGAAILIGDGAADPSKPLNPETIKKEGIKYLTVLQRRHLSPTRIVDDPTSDMFEQPEGWRINTATGTGQVIHPSRLVIFKGDEVPDTGFAATYPGWGDPVLLSVMKAIIDADATSSNVASLVFEAKVDTVGIPGFMNGLQDPSYESKLIRRFRLAEMGKGINGTYIHDADELLGQKNASFASLADIMDRFMQLAAGAADIPMTRLLGQSPAGMNATGDSDMRNYYDKIKAIQTTEFTPSMAVLDECIIRSALGTRKPEIFYEWASLWQLNETERATVGKTTADMIKVLRDTSLFPDEALADSAVNVLTESGVMPGFEDMVNEYYEEHPDEEAGDHGEPLPEPLQPGAEQLGPDGKPLAKASAILTKPEPRKSKVATDAAPRPLYVHRSVVNAKEILAWAKEQGFPSTLVEDDLHVTIAYSSTPLDWMKAGEAWIDQLEIPAGGPRMMERFGDATVLLFVNSHLAWRHEEIKNAGASWDHSEYQPHVTISYKTEGLDLSKVQPYRGKIVLGPEIFEDLNPNWREEKGL